MSQNSSDAGSAVRHDQPPRRIVASFDDYYQAERAVDRLVDAGFPGYRVAIVGRDMEWLEQPAGSADAGTAALRGAGAGGLTGLLVGWIFGLLNWTEPLLSGTVLAGYGLLFGTVVGGAIGLLMQGLHSGGHDFASVSDLRPRHFDVVVDADIADSALHLLEGSGQTTTTTSRTE